MKLEKEFKDKWLTALRSGDYQQTRGKLFDSSTGGYCCLGVAAVVCGGAKPEKIDGHGTINSSTPVSKDFPTMLMHSGQEYRIPLALANMNDGFKHHLNPEGKKYSFAEIADYIEENL